MNVLNTFTKTSKAENEKINYKTNNMEVNFAQAWYLNKKTCYCGEKGHNTKTCPKRESPEDKFTPMLQKRTIKEKKNLKEL